MPGLFALRARKTQRRGWYRKSGLPDFRIKYCYKSGKPDCSDKPGHDERAPERP